MIGGLHRSINKEDLSILADVEGPAGRILLFASDDSVRKSCIALGIAQDRIIQGETFGKFLVGFRVIATGSEIGHIELADFVAARTERLAFRRSTTGKRLGKPSDHDGTLSLVVG